MKKHIVGWLDKAFNPVRRYLCSVSGVNSNSLPPSIITRPQASARAPHRLPPSRTTPTAARPQIPAVTAPRRLQPSRITPAAARPQVPAATAPRHVPSITSRRPVAASPQVPTVIAPRRVPSSTSRRPVAGNTIENTTAPRGLFSGISRRATVV